MELNKKPEKDAPWEGECELPEEKTSLKRKAGEELVAAMVVLGWVLDRVADVMAEADFENAVMIAMAHEAREMGLAMVRMHESVCAEQ